MKNRLFYKSLAVGMGSAALLYLVYVYFNPPGNGEVHIVCMTYTIFGLYCPGCGLTRQMYHLMHGEFYYAWMSNVMGIVLIPIFIIAYLSFVRWAFREKYPPQPPIWLVVVFVIILVIFMILRNIPVEPFTHLVPINPA